MEVALAGIPLSGKTCLFDALTGGTVDATVSPARPERPNRARVAVPDERLDWLSQAYRTPKRTPVQIEWVDLPGLTPGRSDLATQNTAITEHLRRADALVYVLRAFQSDRVPGRVDPVADRNCLSGEFLLADLDTVLRRIEKVEAQLAKPLPNRDDFRKEIEFLGRCREALEAEQHLFDVARTDAERAILRNFASLTQKPVLNVLNVGEDEAGDPQAVAAKYPALGQPTIALCASLEAEIGQLALDERGPFMDELGLKRLRAADVITRMYDVLGRVTFYTAGEKEVAARSLLKGETAIEAAGEVHTDMARGFIRAEVVHYDDFKQAGSLKQARADGHVRLEGRDYVVQDGDIILFHFSR